MVFLYLMILIVFLIHRKRGSIPKGLTLYFANKGTGKTTLLSKFAYLGQNKRKFKKKYPNGTFSNVPISGCKHLDIKEQLGKVNIEKALVLVDEGAIEFDNTTRLPDCQKMFFRLQRHYECDVIVISQSWEDININLRRLYDNMFIMSRSRVLRHMSYIRRIVKYIDINEETNKPEDFYKWAYPAVFSYWFNRKPYYKYFDTHYKPYELPEGVFEVFTEETKKPYVYQDVLHYITSKGKLKVIELKNKRKDGEPDAEGIIQYRDDTETSESA